MNDCQHITQFLTIKKAAEMISVSRWTIQNYIRDGILKAYKAPNTGTGKHKNLRIRRDHLIAIMTEHKTAAQIINKTRVNHK